VNGVRYFTHEQIMDYYGCSAATVYNWLASGRLEVVDIISISLYRELPLSKLPADESQEV